MHLLFDYPWYFVLFCLLAGVVYSALLYFRSAHFSRPLRWGLSVLRFLAVSLIAFLLLSPLVKMETHQKEKPIVVIAQDNSQSVALKSPAGQRKALAAGLQSAIDELSADYDVQVFHYGAELAPCNADDSCTYTASVTDMSHMLDEISDQFAHRNLGAVIITGDGIYNQGANPLSVARDLAYPVYTVAVGDTAMQRDAAIVNLRFNRKVFLGDQFPVEVTLRAMKLGGSARTLTVSHAGKTLYSKTLTYEGEDFSCTETILIDAAQAGLQQFVVTLAADPRETNTQNNSRTLSVEVVDGRQKIAIVAAVPHPDVAAIKSALEGNKNYEVSTFLKSQMQGGSAKLSDYDMVVFHNCVGESNAGSKSQPAIYVVGAQTDLARFNALHLGVEIFSRIAKQNEVTPLLNDAFSHFSVSDGLKNTLEQMPPLISPFGDYRLSPDVQTLCYAKIGNIAGDQPLIAVAAHGESRRVFVLGEGLWRWRLADFLSNNSHDVFDGLMDKMATFACQQADKGRFNVLAKSIYRQDDPVVVEAELYDNNYELTNRPDAMLSISCIDGPQSARTATQHPLNRLSGRNIYSLNLGKLPAGQYRFEGTTVYDNEKFVSSGLFLVEDLNLEEMNLVADHMLLRTLAQMTGGEMVSADSVGSLVQMLRQRDDLKTVIYTQNRYSELVGLPWLFLLILVLVTAEWVLRKYHGTL